MASQDRWLYSCSQHDVERLSWAWTYVRIFLCWIKLGLFCLCFVVYQDRHVDDHAAIQTQASAEPSCLHTFKHHALTHFTHSHTYAGSCQALYTHISMSAYKASESRHRLHLHKHKNYTSGPKCRCGKALTELRSPALREAWQAHPWNVWLKERKKEWNEWNEMKRNEMKWNEMSEWVNEWMSEWVNEWMSEWVNEWMSEWVSEWMNEWMNDWVNEWTNERMNEWMNEWMNGWMDGMGWDGMGWMDGWMDEWMDGWMNDWIMNKTQWNEMKWDGMKWNEINKTKWNEMTNLVFLLFLTGVSG